MLWGLYTLGFDREANDFFYFITDLAEEEADLQIMYGIGGERELTEQILDHLSGYEGARPVRIGNGAWDQRQHDVWGVLLDSFYLHTRSRDRLDERRWPMLERQVEAAMSTGRSPIRAFGRSAVRRSISPVPKSFAGWPWTVEPNWPSSAATTSTRPLAPGCRRDPRRHLRQRDRRPGRLLPALRHHRPGCLGPFDTAVRVPSP